MVAQEGVVRQGSGTTRPKTLMAQQQYCHSSSSSSSSSTMGQAPGVVGVVVHQGVLGQVMAAVGTHVVAAIGLTAAGSSSSSSRHLGVIRVVVVVVALDPPSRGVVLWMLLLVVQ